MLWKSRSKNSGANGREGSDFYSRLKGDITTMRNQGEPPDKDPSSFSKYYCDLCNAVFPLTELKQCTLCGRWACSSCWTTEFYVCDSCDGIVKLHMLPAKQRGHAKE
ncbi:MAG TPA: hypothetical protein VMW63_07045 [Methanoregulaceae archaeon]|nr:hypothetical protein [Methanoregulaceae archaeon]